MKSVGDEGNAAEGKKSLCDEIRWRGFWGKRAKERGGTKNGEANVYK